MKLSVIIPVYNERNTLRTVVDRVLSVPLDMELICVDDGSSDGSREILSEMQGRHPNLRVLLQPRNLGKFSLHRRNSLLKHSSYEKKPFTNSWVDEI
jgi:glycosyltransferase involved in cell wall biosynthesis